jgi:small acid-soluble spore protein B (major beta-type SASP)
MKDSKFVVAGSKQAIENMKYEIAKEFGITLGAETSSRLNGTVGGEITKRLVQLGEQTLQNRNY